MAQPDFASLLRRSMGLDAASIGSAAIGRAVEERQVICGVKDPQIYWERAQGSEAELQLLIEAVVVGETWFFRDPHAFTALARLAHEEWLPARPGATLSLLSLPCSTGEEPFSMAMALLDANIPAQRFRVDAVDISARNVAHALRAVYGRNSFRGQDLEYRGRHFEPVADGYRVEETVRQQVHFQQGNLFAPDFLPGTEIYDAIFCRNVLIYFDRPTQDRALVVLNRLLSAKGILFVAPAETALPTSHKMVSANQPLAFAFRKSGPLPAGPKRTPVRVLQPPAPPRRPAAAAGPEVSALGSRASLPPARRTPVGDLPVRPAAGGKASLAADLSDATRLADQGHFAEAATCCEEHLRRSGPSAMAFYLMGLVRDASGIYDEAAAYYRKALYLDPNHYDTQIHLALLMEKQGDTTGAQVLRNRARRLEAKHKGT